MCCHKKCISKCQNATVCGSAADSTASSSQFGANPEFKVTEVGDLHTPDVAPDDLLDPCPSPAKAAGDGHRASIGDFIAQGLKRVNSANNLAIPALVSSLSQSTKSLPPSPQQTPRQARGLICKGRSLIFDSFPENNPWLIQPPVPFCSSPSDWRRLSMRRRSRRRTSFKSQSL